MSAPQGISEVSDLIYRQEHRGAGKLKVVKAI